MLLTFSALGLTSSQRGWAGPLQWTCSGPAAVVIQMIIPDRGINLSGQGRVVDRRIGMDPSPTGIRWGEVIAALRIPIRAVGACVDPGLVSDGPRGAAHAVSDGDVAMHAAVAGRTHWRHARCRAGAGRAATGARAAIASEDRASANAAAAPRGIKDQREVVGRDHARNAGHLQKKNDKEKA